MSRFFFNFWRYSSSDKTCTPIRPSNFSDQGLVGSVAWTVGKPISFLCVDRYFRRAMFISLNPYWRIVQAVPATSILGRIPCPPARLHKSQKMWRNSQTRKGTHILILAKRQLLLPHLTRCRVIYLSLSRVMSEEGSCLPSVCLYPIPVFYEHTVSKVQSGRAMG